MLVVEHALAPKQKNMPVQTLDHIQFIGGMLNGSILNTRALYRDIVRDIYSTYP
mgnify:CR=1 FL=1